MINDKLREILVDYYHRVNNDENKGLPTIKAISQIKALVRKSFGRKKSLSGRYGDTSFQQQQDIGYNQHIAEMKEKYK